MRFRLHPRWARAANAGLAASLLLPPPLLAQSPPSRGNGAAPTSTASGASRSKSAAPVTLNFVNADVEAVTRAIGAMLDRQILVDPRVKGTITVYSEQAVSIREAYLTYQAALRGLGFSVVENGGFLKVVPEADAKLQAGTVTVGPSSQRGDQVVTQIFRLNYENPNNLVAVLRPLISANNTINANPANSSLVITDYADNLQRLGKIIAALDQPSTTDIEVIPVKAAAASDLAPIVQRLADSSGAQAGVPGAPAGGGGGVSVLPDARSNSLIVRASNPARLAYVRAVIDKLDQPTQGSGPAGNIWVVYLKNADAAKLATVLRAAFSGGSGGGGGAGAGGSSSGSSGSSPFGGANSSASSGSTGANQGLTNAAGGGQSAAAATPVQASAGPSTGGNIQADPSTNSLIITAPEPLYRQMRGVIDQLDARRVQVAIESMIVEVSGDNSADFGFQWQGLLGKNGDKYGLAGGTNFSGPGNIISLTTAGATGGTGTGTTTTGTGGLSLGSGLNIALIRDFGGSYGLAAIARFLQNQTNTNIVSTPNLITLDNEEAKIVVGQNVPFITGQFTNTGTATTSPFQTIERKDVGVTLRIKPQIGEGGTVRMTIYQESSSIAPVATGTGTTGPTTNKRSIESTVVVDDGAILVLGGLIEDRYSQTTDKVPLLGDIPYVGALFRSENRTKNRTNLMVFLRPVVMRDADSTLKYSMDRYDLIRAQQKDAQPKPNILLPISDSPVLPPVRAVDETTLPLSVPPSSPGSTPPKPPPAPEPPASAPVN